MGWQDDPVVGATAPPATASKKPWENDPIVHHMGPQEHYDPTEGMSFGQKVAAGFGKAFVDTAKGLKQAGQDFQEFETGGDAQHRSQAMRQDTDEDKHLDAPLLATKAGRAGNIAGGIAATAPLLAIPGVNTVAGAAVTGAVLGATQRVGTDDSRLKNTVEGAAFGAVGQKVGQVAGRAIAKRFAPEVEKAIEPAERMHQEAVQAAQKAGYVLPPSMAKPNTLNSVLEGFSGKIKTGQEASMVNEANTDRLVRTGLGISEDAPLTRETLLQVRKEAGKAYQVLQEHAEPFETTAEYHKAIDNIGDVTKRLAEKYPKLFDNRDIDVLKQSLKVDSMTGEDVVELTKALRQKADDLWSPTASGADKSVARAYRQASDAIENMAEANLERSGNTKVLEDFRNSRQVIAKSYSVEKALTGNGHVDARKLALQLKRNKPLSGDLKTAAEFAGNFKKAAQTSEQVGSIPKISPLDAMAALLTPHGAAGAAAALLGRPIVRAAILSPTGQRILTGAEKAGVKEATSAVGKAVQSVAKKASKGVPGAAPVAKKVGQRLLKDHQSDEQKTGTDE